MTQDFCFHIHTPRCNHADTSMSDELIARLFFEAGFKSIAFTDHSPWKTFLKRLNNNSHAMEWEQKDEYLASVRKLAEEYKGRMTILTGLECEYFPEFKDEMKILRNDADILVHGQHFIQREDGSYISFHKNGYVPNDCELNTYATWIEDAAKTGYSDIIAHPDLYLIHREEFKEKDEEVAHRICAAAEKYNKPIEINLAQVSRKIFVDKDFRVTYPRREFWNIAKEYNVKTIVGLDYHGYFHPERFDEAADYGKDLIGRDIIDKLQICFTVADLT